MMLAWLFFPGLCDLRVLVVASKEHKYRNCQDRVEHLLGAFYILHNILGCRCSTSFNWTEVHAISIGVTTVCGTGIWTAWDCAKFKSCGVGVWNSLRSAPSQSRSRGGWMKGNKRTIVGPAMIYRIPSSVGIATCKHMITPEEQQDLDSRRPEGWLWQLGKMGRLSQSEMEEWSNKGDRVQWFRAEAEMRQWQEQKEQKLVELLWTIRSYVKMQSVWSQLGDSHANQPGHAAYARQKA
ncbi:hypothetical protein DFH09DRAFT_1477909 [Mycena vulgaris]|nr:hypothetical protein DFH09DRAFT_1477909 [Mycena vulgaris]